MMAYTMKWTQKMYRKRKQPPSDGYDYEIRQCPICGSMFSLAPFHMYAWEYKRNPKDWKHKIFLCGYKCDNRIKGGEFDICMTNGKLPYTK